MPLKEKEKCRLRDKPVSVEIQEAKYEGTDPTEEELDDLHQRVLKAYEDNREELESRFDGLWAYVSVHGEALAVGRSPEDCDDNYENSESTEECFMIKIGSPFEPEPEQQALPYCTLPRQDDRIEPL